MPDHGRFEGQLAFSFLSYFDGNDDEGGNLYDLFAVVEEFIPESFDAALKKAGVPIYTEALAKTQASFDEAFKKAAKAKKRRKVGTGNAATPAPKKRRRVTPK